MTFASDADREATVERLRVAYEEGRLTRGELDERVDGAYRARTHDELVVLERGLPAAVAAAGPPAAAGTGYPAGQVAAAVLLTLLVPFGDVAAVVIALAMRGSAATPAQRRQLTWWALGSGALVVAKLLVLLLVVGV